MQEIEHSLGNAQTLWTDLSSLSFEPVEQSGGIATVIRFRLNNHAVRLGDVLVVLEGADVRFHGMITSIDDEGWAVAADRRGSRIPAGVQ